MSIDLQKITSEYSDQTNLGLNLQFFVKKMTTNCPQDLEKQKFLDRKKCVCYVEGVMERGLKG